MFQTEPKNYYPWCNCLDIYSAWEKARLMKVGKYFLSLTKVFQSIKYEMIFTVEDDKDVWRWWYV